MRPCIQAGASPPARGAEGACDASGAHLVAMGHVWPRAALGAARFAMAACGALALAAADAPEDGGTAEAGSIRVLTIDGVISPVSTRYLLRELQAAQRANAPLVVLELNTPGGLESSMREMTQALLASRVPVAVYVTPGGARAASAGMFITLAGNVAAMAPGTNIGAAHPVSVGGGDGSGGQDEVRSRKVLNDAAALARSLASERGRNAAWAESAVRESASITAEEARAMNVIDLIAANRAQLLERLDGLEVTTAGGTAIIRTAGVPVEERPMTTLERILEVVIDPNVAYLLFMLGLAGLAAEVFSPGLLVPGILGGLCLILAFVAFGSLPINWGGVLLLVIAVGLLATELMTSGFGFLGGAGIVALLLGSLLLFSPLSPPSPAAPNVKVSPWLVAVVGAGMAAWFLFVLRALARSRRAAVRMGPETLVGKEAVTLTELAPRGRVLVDSEEWTAEADERVRPGRLVRITGVEGVTLRVRPPAAGPAAGPAP
jgi:membrane-bound serine protease (ClpP class)